MKRRFWIILLIFVLIWGLTLSIQATGEAVNDNSNEIEEQEQMRSEGEVVWTTILDMKDPQGDDFGPGTYLYPTNSQFAPYQGLLDIERFKVLGREDQICLQITFGQITNPWKGSNGFSHQLIEIYIDHRPGGERHTFYPGARVVFSPRASWDTLIKVTGWGIYLFDCDDSVTQEPDFYSEGEAKVLEDQKTIQIILPISEWTNLDDLQDGSYYLLVGGHDGFGPDHYRIVEQGISEWYFGGGDGSGYNPNVIDMVVPDGRSQQKILGSYDPANHVRAVVEPVSKPNPVRKVIIYLVSFIICLLIWLGWHKRGVFTRSQ